MYEFIHNISLCTRQQNLAIIRWMKTIGLKASKHHKMHAIFTKNFKKLLYVRCIAQGQIQWKKGEVQYLNNNNVALIWLINLENDLGIARYICYQYFINLRVSENCWYIFQQVKL